ncbi:MAG: hypothetical protein H7Z21_10230, partial [Hymenobacter sp.]|nr:hypothetical protein [Hymenobacter sp.]
MKSTRRPGVGVGRGRETDTHANAHPCLAGVGAGRAGGWLLAGMGGTTGA